MNSRERVLAALNHKEPDKVPIDIGGTMTCCFTGPAYEKLKEYLINSEKIKSIGEEKIVHPLLDVVVPPEEVLLLFESDCRGIRMKGPEDKLANNKVERIASFSSANLRDRPHGDIIIDELGTKWKKITNEYSPAVYPLMDADLDELKKYPFPDAYNFGRIEGLREEARDKHNKTDFAICSDIICGGPYENSQWLRGYERFLLDMMTNKKFAQALLEKITDYDIQLWDALLSEIGKHVDIVCQGEDLGSSHGLQINPELYRKMIKPHHKRLFSFIQSKTNAKIWLHSCGSVYDVIPDLIEMGVDVLNPVQTSARNMDLLTLKKEYGKDIAFWGGGINVEHLPNLSTKEIHETVKRNIDIMSKGGGFIFASTHNIMPETEGEKSYEAFMAARKFRKY